MVYDKFMAELVQLFCCDTHLHVRGNEVQGLGGQLAGFAHPLKVFGSVDNNITRILLIVAVIMITWAIMVVVMMGTIFHYRHRLLYSQLIPVGNHIIGF